MLLSVSSFRRSLKSELIELHPGEEGPLPGVDEELDDSEDPGESKLLPGDKIPSGLSSSFEIGAVVVAVVVVVVGASLSALDDADGVKDEESLSNCGVLGTICVYEED